MKYIECNIKRNTILRYGVGISVSYNMLQYDDDTIYALQAFIKLTTWIISGLANATVILGRWEMRGVNGETKINVRDLETWHTDRIFYVPSTRCFFALSFLSFFSSSFVAIVVSIRYCRSSIIMCLQELRHGLAVWIGGFVVVVVDDEYI